MADQDRQARIVAELQMYAESDGMTDDERARHFGLPYGCRMRERAKILGRDGLHLGEHVWIGENTMLDATGGLSIGSHTSISCGAMIWTHSSALANLALHNEIGSPFLFRKPVEIGSGCYIGGPCNIGPGVTIGDFCIVLPMSAVTDDVPSRSMVGGAPASIVADLTPDYLRRLFARHGMSVPDHLNG